MENETRDPLKGTEIIINGRTMKVSGPEISWDELVRLAFPTGERGEQIAYTVTFEDGGGREQIGELTEGHFVKIQDGTRFHVTRTDRS